MVTIPRAPKLGKKKSPKKGAKLGKKGANLEASLKGSTGMVLFEDAALREAKTGVPPKKKFQNFWSNIFLRSSFEKSNTL